MELKKLSIVKGGLKITYLSEESKNGAVYYKEVTEKKTADPHPDLGIELQKFGDYVGQILKKDDLSNIIVTGIAISGTGENERIKIDFQYNGGELTAKFYIAAGMYDFEEAILQQILALEREAELYLFSNKVAQLEVMFDEED